MKNAWITNIVLVLLVTALAIYAIYRPGADSEALPFQVSALSKSTVDRILIEPKGQASIEVRRRGDDWMLQQPFVARADRAQIDRLLDLLSARSREKLAAVDLARFDLEAPAVRVTFNDKTIAFGTSNPMSQEQYVLSADAVYLLGAHYRNLVPEDAQRLLTHALLKPGEKPVGFTLPGFTVQQRDGKWEMQPVSAAMAEKDRPSQDDFNRWVDDWRLSSSLLTRHSAESRAPEWIELRLAGGQTLRLGILRRDPELVLMRPDEKLSFFFSSETKERLLSPPVAAQPSGTPAAPSSAVPAR